MIVLCGCPARQGRPDSRGFLGLIYPANRFVLTTCSSLTISWLVTSLAGQNRCIALFEGVGLEQVVILAAAYRRHRRIYV